MKGKLEVKSSATKKAKLFRVPQGQTSDELMGADFIGIAPVSGGGGGDGGGVGLSGL